MVWAITKGSLLNKLIILPLAFLLSGYMPFLIVPILLLGGCYLCYEGVEKIVEWFVPHKHAVIAAQETADPQELLKRESIKIKAAVRTDFILSIEIIVIALGAVMDQDLTIQIIVVGFVALLATVGVYGLVALLVRMDDGGIYLIERADEMKGFSKRCMEFIGETLVAALPKVIRLLAVVGTVAMLLVGGGMFVHNIEAVHHAFVFLPGLTADFTAGVVVGFIVFVPAHILSL